MKTLPHSLTCLMMFFACLVPATAQVIAPEQATYEACNYLSLIGQYETAAKGYASLLRAAPHADIYHNAGINQALIAQSYLPPTTGSHVYPFQMGARKQTVSDDPNQARHHLHQAIAYLNQGIAKDARAMMYVDYASVLAQLQRYEEAMLSARRARILLGKPSNSPRIWGFSLIVESICAAESGQTQLAAACAQEAATLKDLSVNALLAANSLNQQRAQDEPLPILGLERIEGRTAAEFIRDEKPRLPATPVGLPDDGPIIQLYSRSHSYAYAYKMDWKTAYFLFTNPTYRSPTSGGIHIGAQQQTVLDQYGAPQAIRLNQTGELWYYDKGGIIFRLGEKGHVEGWVTYFVH